jgi:hypothetical protein
VLLDPHFSDVDPDSVEYEPAGFSSQRPSRAWTKSENFTASDGLVCPWEEDVAKLCCLSILNGNGLIAFVAQRHRRSQIGKLYLRAAALV